MKRKQKKLLIKVVLILILLLIGGLNKDELINYIETGKFEVKNTKQDKTTTKKVFLHTDSIDNIPPYNNEPYVIINNNNPSFNLNEDYSESFELYSDLDDLGRCGIAYANIGFDLMPTEPRGEIGMIKPSGWHTIKYDIVENKYLYNRCHLIGYQLTGENANPKNLITCTRSMNVKGMLDFENQVTSYIKETNNHVLYRVTPIYKGVNLVASGVVMEAYSVEDNGKGIKFNVYVYNNQPGIEINYLNGESKLIKE